jgi:hypothetical protein
VCQAALQGRRRKRGGACVTREVDEERREKAAVSLGMHVSGILLGYSCKEGRRLTPTRIPRNPTRTPAL